ISLSFFFFQAEDGIRDFHVTGVQTCALPICSTRAVAGAARLYGPFIATADHEGRVRVRRLATPSLATGTNFLPAEPAAESGLSSSGPRAASDHPSHLPCGAERPTYRNDPHL